MVLAATSASGGAAMTTAVIANSTAAAERVRVATSERAYAGDGYHRPHMARLLQVREVPDDVHRTLKVRAAQAGTSLSEYVRAELELIASRPTPEELRTRLATRTPVEASESPAKAIRRRRDA